jgi:hypothetical protein
VRPSLAFENHILTLTSLNFASAASFIVGTRAARVEWAYNHYRPIMRTFVALVSLALALPAAEIRTPIQRQPERKAAPDFALLDGLR